MDKLNELDHFHVERNLMAQVLYPAGDTATRATTARAATRGTEAALANAPLKGAGISKSPGSIERNEYSCSTKR